MDETMPIPVTTTRRMASFPSLCRGLSTTGAQLARPGNSRKGLQPVPAREQFGAQALLGCSASSCLNRPTFRSLAL